MMNVLEKIEALRLQMKKQGVDYYIVPTADFHQSEYVGEHFKAREYITGFTGSAGTALFTATEAYLWTDGRYFIQASQELQGSTITLMKMGEPFVPTIEEYLEEHVESGQCVGFDGRCVSAGEGKEYEKICQRKQASIFFEEDLVDSIWEHRPPMSKEPAFHLEECYSGETTESKLARIREEMKKEEANLHVLTTLDDICWTLNFRGNDIAYFPLVLAYALIDLEGVTLYIDSEKADEAMRADFKKNLVTMKPYDQIYEDIKHLNEDVVMLLDPAKINYAMDQLIPPCVKKKEKRNPEILMKAIKNSVEVENIRKAQIKDSIAHVRFMKWLKENVGKTKITEMSASDQLDAFRMELPNFLRPSFDPICSFGEHAAIVHYTSTEETDVELCEGQMFLTDTGAGFMEGSTDITRTYAFGEIPREMKEHFTLVAISNLALANAKFLEKSTGMTLDYIARKPFWDRNLNFNHGTGHGVGYLLNIHEGPAGFRFTYREGETEMLKEGMILTDEPGIYIEGSHGVRLENELLVCKGEKNEYGQFMYFDTITLVPFDLDAILPEMMTKEEIAQLNAYHELVFHSLKEYLTEDEVEWLKVYTRKI